MKLYFIHGCDKSDADPTLGSRRKFLTKKFNHIFTSARHRDLLPDVSVKKTTPLCELKYHTSKHYCICQLYPFVLATQMATL